MPSSPARTSKTTKSPRKYRASTAIGPKLDFQLGAFTPTKRLSITQTIVSPDPYTGQIITPLSGLYNYTKEFTLADTPHLPT